MLRLVLKVNIYILFQNDVIIRHYCFVFHFMDNARTFEKADVEIFLGFMTDFLIKVTI